MANKWKRVAAIAATTVMAASALSALTACGPKGDPNAVTYRTFTSVMPSNWNLFTYEDNNDTQISDYITGSLFEYDYEFDEAKGGKFKEDGSINVDAIVEDSFVTKYSAATALEDVTATVDAKWGYTAAQKEEGGYAWKITLRDDLKWDDGTVINADSFVYSMEEQLNPKFLNFRANTYYQTLIVKNARDYFYKLTDETYETVGSQGYASNAAAVAADADIYVDVFAFWGANGYVDEDGNPVSQWVPYDDDTVYDIPDVWEAYAEYDTTEKQEAFLTQEGLIKLEDGKWATGNDPAAEGYKVYNNTDIAFATVIGSDAFTAAELWEYFLGPDGQYADYTEVGGAYESWVSIKVENTGDRTVTFEDVGFYKASENSVVICMDKSYQFLKDDGDLSYLAAYYMSTLPLVKKDLYEKCKKAPAAGSTLWTSDYCSSKDKTASWGPYKLTQFQSGKSYTLAKNNNWYGYNMEDNKNQYKINKIACECIPKEETQWLNFLKGDIDDISLDANHIADYMYSKYAKFASGTGTYGMQLYGNLPTLKNNGRNNGILAIEKFRKAFSLSLNRTDVVSTIWPGTSIPCYGAMNQMYYYDVVNAATYRGTTQAKEALLRVYGFTKNPDGTWTDGGNITNATLDEAYEAMNGYNPVQAKELLIEAYNELMADKEKYGYNEDEKIVFIYGTSTDNTRNRDRAEYVQNVLNELAKDTPLEGKFEVQFNASYAQDWANAFKAGAYEIAFGTGFSGNALNPFDMIGAFVDNTDKLNYHSYWNTSSETVTFTMPAGDYAEAGQEITMSIKNWFDCLNGYAALNNDTYTYNWDAGKVSDDVRLSILAMLEETALSKYYSVMLIAEYNGSLLSPKFSYLSDDYNLFMGYGGMRYIQVNYKDSEWSSYVSGKGGNLENEYKKTN